MKAAEWRENCRAEKLTVAGYGRFFGMEQFMRRM